jgi:signal transduction histidine kinase
VVFAIDVQTAPEVYDIERVEGGLLPIVAAGAAVPVGLILSRPLVGWLIAAVSALTFSQVFALLDDDPWPWPPIHGLVVLALLFSFIAVRPPRNLPQNRGVPLKVAVSIATAILFSTLSDDHAGWVVAVTAVAAAGALVRWLATDDAASRPEPSPRPAQAWVGVLRQGFRTAFIGWTKSPPTGRPFGQRWFGDPDWLQWLRVVGSWILAFVVFWIALADVDGNLVVHSLALPVLSAAIALPVGLLRDRILLGWRLATVVAVILALVATPSESALAGQWPVSLQWVWIGSIFFVSVRHDRWTTVWVWLVSVLALSAGLPENSGTATTLIVFASGAALVGDLIRSRAQAAHQLEEQAELSELEKARRAVLEEKARIARDLHDIVAHHMSMVVVQAETAPFRIDDLSEGAKAELGSISATAREALGEIRGLLGVLRSEGQDRTYAPQPGAGDIQELVDGARRSGVDASLTTSGEERDIASATELSAYRIVQESLANAARHAPGTEVSVFITFGEGALELRVTNAAPESALPPGSPGHGIIGMRERAAVVGGTFHASRTADGGFEVRASLPRHIDESEGEQ